MKYKKPILTALVLVSCLVLFCSMPVFAAELTEAQVEEAVAEQGKEAVTGNVVHLVPLCYCFPQGFPEDRQLYGIPGDQCRKHWREHDGGAAHCRPGPCRSLPRTWRWRRIPQGILSWKRSRWRQLSLRRPCRGGGTPGTAGSRQCCYPLFGRPQRREYASISPRSRKAETLPLT